MSNPLRTFDFNEVPVRVVERVGEPWWVAADVCRALEIQNSRDAVAGLDDDEKSIADAGCLRSNVGSNDVSVPNRGLSIVSESGLYSLIFNSRKPEARAFKRWVTHEVLPALRKTGHYETGEPTASEQAEWDLENVFDLARRGAEQLLAMKPLNASGAGALALLVQECRKVYELRFRIAPPTALLPSAGSYDNTEEVATVLCAVAARMEEPESRLRLSDLWACALERGMCRDIVRVPEIAPACAKAFGRRLQSLRGKTLEDARGRMFRVLHHRTKHGAVYVFQFCDPEAAR